MSLADRVAGGVSPVVDVQAAGEAALAVARPALLVFCFVPLGVPSARAELDRQWERCARLGMDDPVRFPDEPSIEVPLDLPADFNWIVGKEDFRILAGRQRSERAGWSDEGSLRWAVLFARHDLIGLIAAFVPGELSAGPKVWASLKKDWDGSETSQPGELLLAKAELAYGLDPSWTSGEAASEASDKLLLAAFAALGEQRPWGTASTIAGGFLVAGGWQAHQRFRGVVIGPPDADDKLSRWAFWQGLSRLAPLPDYLVHAAKLHYQWRTYIGGGGLRSRIYEQTRASDESVDALLKVIGDRSEQRVQALVRGRGELGKALAESGGPLRSVSTARELRETVAIAEVNMHEASRREKMPPPRSWPTTVGPRSGCGGKLVTTSSMWTPRSSACVSYRA
jgi:hypothetical protein